MIICSVAAIFTGFCPLVGVVTDQHKEQDVDRLVITPTLGKLFPETEQKIENKEVLRYRDAILWGFENI